MANKKITLKKRLTGGTYDVLYPETKKVNILQDDGSALTTFGASVLETNVAVSEPGFAVSLTTTGDALTDYKLYPATAAEAREYFEVAKTEHYHTISQIQGLGGALNLKVPLDGNNKIPQEYFPEVNTDSMTFAGAVSGASTAASATTLLEGLGVGNTGTGAFLSGLLDDNDDVLPNQKGRYTIVSTNAGYFKNHSVTVGSQVFDIKFRQLNTAFPNFEEVDDVQDSNTYLAVQLEPGDRIVLTDIVKNSATSYTLWVDVINTNYSYGGVNLKGAASLSNETSLNSMAGASSSANVVDEKVMRDSMKDIAYEESYTSATTITTSTVLRYGLSNPTTSTEGAVNDKYINISTGALFKCTALNDGTLPVTYTWVSDGSIANFSKSALDVSTYYVINSNYWVVASDAGANKTTSGYLENLEPVADDLVFVA